MTVTQTSTTAFNMEEFGKENEREYIRLGIPLYDLRIATPNTHLSQVFRCTKTIQARITPFVSMFFLDFVDNLGKRIEQRTHLDVFDGVEGDGFFYGLMKPFGTHYLSECKLEVYMLHSARAYEIRSAGVLLKTIKFPITTTVQCA